MSFLVSLERSFPCCCFVEHASWLASMLLTVRYGLINYYKTTDLNVGSGSLPYTILGCQCENPPWSFYDIHMEEKASQSCRPKLWVGCVIFGLSPDLLSPTPTLPPTFQNPHHQLAPICLQKLYSRQAILVTNWCCQKHPLDLK